ncbi:MAG: PH domain-containing protein [Bauldia sp.]
MSYVQSVLQSGERVLAVGRLHWIVYLPGILLGLLGVLLLIAGGGAGEMRYPLLVLGGLVLAAGLIVFIREWFRQWITELAVTDRRVILKTGFVRRRTVEMNMDKVETVDVDQSVFGRVLGYGTIHVRGTGSGIEHLHRVAQPLALRSAITAK